MQYRIDVSSQAAADLRNLFRYISDTLRAPENAYTQLARIRKQILGLAELPMRFRAYPKHFAGYPQVRIMPVDHFEVFYTVDTGQEKVTILRVIYGGRDIDRAFMP